MTIREITDVDVLQRCGVCENERRIGLDDLEVGVAYGEQVDGHLLPMPACPECGTTEFLIRTPDDEKGLLTKGGLTHKHHMLVDHLHAELVHRGKVHKGLGDGDDNVPLKIARRLSDEERERWFPDGLRVAPLAEKADLGR